MTNAELEIKIQEALYTTECNYKVNKINGEEWFTMSEAVRDFRRLVRKNWNKENLSTIERTVINTPNVSKGFHDDFVMELIETIRLIRDTE